ncbi:MAG: hypothetical protein J6I72_03320 [Muribaculaceae bacterium]|nr:hypothetical protein [Muribaculaceae bacterium]
MKKFFICLVTALVASLNLSAQNEWKNEISISYGPGTFTDLSSSYLKGIFSGKQTNYIGAFGVEYFHRPKTALGVGLVGTFSTCKWNDSDKARTKYLSIMPAVKYNWLQRDHFSMYSKAAIGVLIGIDTGDNTDKTKVSFGWQASLVGAEFGGAFRGFAELGFGEQGLLVAGLRYKF